MNFFRTLSVIEENGMAMNIGMISYADEGNWYLGSEGIPLLLVKCHGMLLYCQSPDGRVYYPAHDVVRQISEEEASRLMQNQTIPKFDNHICRRSSCS